MLFFSLYLNSWTKPKTKLDDLLIEEEVEEAEEEENEVVLTKMHKVDDVDRGAAPI